MFKNQFIFLVALVFLATSCGDTISSVKRGLTGQKQKSTDEFLVKKKDPLIFPPNFEDLPTPTDRDEALDKISSFEKTLKKTSLTEISSSAAGSAEESILQQIKKK